MVLHVFTSFLGGVLLCIPYGLYSGTSLGGTTWRTLGGYPGRVLSLSQAKSLLGKSKLQSLVIQRSQGRSRPITEVAT